jgi:hypothetical protein
MIDQMTLQTIGILITGISLTVAAFYYIMTLRNQEKARQAQLFMQLYNRFQSIEFHRQFNKLLEWEFNDFEDFLNKYGRENNPEAYALRGSVGGYFEGMGVLVKRGLIDVTLADDLISGAIMLFWDKFGPIYLEMRERINYPQFAEWTEYLYNQIKPLVEEQHPETTH